MFYYLLRVSLWIHYLFREFTIRIATPLWIHYLFHYEFALNPLFSAKPQLIHFLLRELTLNSLISAKSLWIYYLFRDNTLNLLSVSRNQYEFTICFANGRRIHYLLRDLTRNSSSFSRIHCLHCDFSFDSLGKTIINSLWINDEITMTLLWIHYLLRDFTRNSSSFSRIHYRFREFN